MAVQRTSSSKYLSKSIAKGRPQALATGLTSSYSSELKLITYEALKSNGRVICQVGTTVHLSRTPIAQSQFSTRLSDEPISTIICGIIHNSVLACRRTEVPSVRQEVLLLKSAC